MKTFTRATLLIVLACALGTLGGCERRSARHAAQNAEPEPDDAISVQAEEVQRQSLQAWVYSQGTVRSRQREFLTFTQPGMVTWVDPQLRVGSWVKASQVIARQNPERVSADLQAAQAGVAQAEANLALAQVTLQRFETLIEQQSAAQQELDQARVQVQQARAARDSARAQQAQAQINMNDSRLVSPINGVIARLNTEKGRYFIPASVQAGTELGALRTMPAVVIDPHHFEVRVDLPSFHFRQIALGAQAVIGGEPPTDGRDIDPTAQDNGRVKGQVYAVRPTLDPDSRTFEVLVHADGKELGLQDGEFAAVWIQEPTLREALAVPLAALRFRNGQSFVFVVDQATGKVAERPVDAGAQSGTMRAITHGLAAGEQVVTHGRAALHDGMRVRVIPAARSGP